LTQRSAPSPDPASSGDVRAAISKGQTPHPGVRPEIAGSAFIRHVSSRSSPRKDENAVVIRMAWSGHAHDMVASLQSLLDSH
jgi:hypothetical protein